MRAHLQSSTAAEGSAAAAREGATPSVHLAGADTGHDYRVTGTAERLALLEQLRDSSAPVLMHTAAGATLHTRLWVVDAAASRLAFAVAASELGASQLQPMLEADEVSAVAHPGQIKLQFELHGLVLVRGNASAVLQAALPDELLRFQRRETYRVCPPVSAPVAYMRHPAMPEMSLALRVLDLSLGGCALRLPDDVPVLEPGTCINNVTVELDLNTRLRVQLTLQHLTNLGVTGARVGCEWQLARPEDERVLQRWIDQAQVRLRMNERSARRGAAPGAAPSPAAGWPAAALPATASEAMAARNGTSSHTDD